MNDKLNKNNMRMRMKMRMRIRDEKKWEVYIS